MVPISPQVFSGGAVVFDTRSLFDYQQRLAERRAKRDAAEQEALDNYLKELGKTPDPYGMRKNDIPTFNKKLNDFRQLSNDFKKAPKNLESRLKLQQAADDLKIFVARSKEEKEKDKSYNNLIADLAANPEKRKTTNVEKLIADKTNQDLPLDFPGVAMLGIPARADKDFNPNYYIPKPFDFKSNFDEAAKGPGITVSELSATPSKTSPGFNVIQRGFGNSAIKSIASNFAKNVEADDEKESYYRIRFKNLTPEKLTEHNVRLKKYFPAMEVDDDNPVSLAMAEAIEEAEKRTSSDLQAISKGTTINLDREGKKGFVDYYGEMEEKLKTPKTIGKPGLPESQRIKGFPVNELSAITQERLIDISKKLTGQDYNQGNLLIQRNPKDKLIYLSFVEKDDATGIPISVTQLVPLTKQDINLEPQVGVQEKREAASEAAFPAPKTGTTPAKQNTYVIKGKTYSEKDLINMGYTLDQIKPYMKK